jgi:uncharacterized cupredoxin-like copper-binding protein
MQQKSKRPITPARLAAVVPVFAIFSFLAGSAREAEPPRHLNADTTTITIQSNGTELSFDPNDIAVKQGAPVRIRYVNNATFAHNIVIVKKDADIDVVGPAAQEASGTGYVPMQHTDRMIAWSPLAEPGKTVEFTFTAPTAGTYPFACLVDGHYNVMVGTIRSK